MAGGGGRICGGRERDDGAAARRRRIPAAAAAVAHVRAVRRARPQVRCAISSICQTASVFHLHWDWALLPCGRAPSAHQHALSGMAVSLTVACYPEASVPEGFALFLHMCYRILHRDKSARLHIQ